MGEQQSLVDAIRATGQQFQGAARFPAEATFARRFSHRGLRPIISPASPPHNAWRTLPAPPPMYRPFLDWAAGLASPDLPQGSAARMPRDNQDETAATIRMRLGRGW